jgi:hypothetical protein
MEEQMKLNEAPDDVLVKAFIELRDKRSAIKAAFEAEDSKLKARQEQIEAILLARYNERGVESSRTAYGTAYKTTVGYASVVDKEAFKNYVVENNAWELLTISANKSAIKQYIDENNDLPPGVNWREELHVRVNRA